MWPAVYSLMALVRYRSAPVATAPRAGSSHPVGVDVRMGSVVAGAAGAGLASASAASAEGAGTSTRLSSAGSIPGAYSFMRSAMQALCRDGTSRTCRGLQSNYLERALKQAAVAPCGQRAGCGLQVAAGMRSRPVNAPAGTRG